MSSPVARRWLRTASGAIRPIIAGLWRRTQHLRGVDRTALLSSQPCLILAPHPDDESLGCGATIARKVAAGADVWVLVAADGRGSHPNSRLGQRGLAKIRSREVVDACSSLGIPEERVTQLGHHDGTLSASLESLDGIVRSEVVNTGVTEVFVTWGRDPQPDHQALSSVARKVVRDLPDVRLLEYPIWGWVRGPWLWSTRPQPGLLRTAWRLLADPLQTLRGPRPWLVATDQYLDSKMTALGKHRTQFTNYSGEADWAVLGQAFLGPLTGRYELFFPIEFEDE